MRDLVCISHLRWDFVWQRPQQILSRLARQYRVWFVEEPVTTVEETIPRMEMIEWQGARRRSVTVLRLVQPASHPHWIGHGDPLTASTYSRLLFETLSSQGVKNPLVWLYTPMGMHFLDVLKPSLLVYDVMDQLSAFRGAPTELKDQERMLLRRAHVVFTGGASLYRAKLAYNPHTFLLPSGVEIDHFAPAANREQIERPTDMPHMQGPVIGYYGVIDERMDLDLIRRIAAERPHWQIVLVGPIAKLDQAELPQAPNIHYLGMKTYDQLPSYLAYFDVALVPFMQSDATRYLSPTKTLEYMAARKPIVSTPIHDVIELYGAAVRIGYSPLEFIEQIERALEDDPTARRATEDQLLFQHTWDTIATRMSRVMELKLERKGAGRRTRTQAPAAYAD
jgi:UDP-galactopyranose mutase